MFKIISPFTKNCFGKQVHYFDGKKSTAVRNFMCNLKKGFLRDTNCMLVILILLF